MAAKCTCPPDDFVDVTCSTHGLVSKTGRRRRWRRMDKYAKRLPCKRHGLVNCISCRPRWETAAEVQQRLVRESLRPAEKSE